MGDVHPERGARRPLPADLSRWVAFSHRCVGVFQLGYGEQGSPPKIGGGDALVFIMEIISIDGNKVAANRCDPSSGNKGCDEQEVKYIEKINKHYAELVRASNHHKISESKYVSLRLPETSPS